MKNFRSLYDIKWIPFHEITVFTGENDGGKTAVLHALEYFLKIKHIPEIEDFSRISSEEFADEILLEGLFEIDDTEKELLNRLTSFEEDIIHVIKIYKQDGSEPHKFKTKVHPDPKFQRDLGSVKLNELIELTQEYDISLEGLDKRKKDPILEKIRAWLFEQNLIKGYLELPKVLVDRLPSIEIFCSADTLDPEEEIHKILRASFSGRLGDPRYSGPLERILNKIKEDIKEDLNQLIPFINEYCPDVEKVDVEPFFDLSSGLRATKLLLKKNGLEVDLERMGEGRKRRITLAVHEWNLRLFESRGNQNASLNQIILAFDEPDTHLDYISQRKLFGIIRKLANQKDVCVLVCTHSLNLIDRVPITYIVHFKLEDNATLIETLDTEKDPDLVDYFLYQINDAMGLKNSILLNERCFLIVEGNTEMNALPVLYHFKYDMSLQATGIRILNGEGNSGAFKFAKFLHDHKRNVIFLVDEDSRSGSNSNNIFTEEKLEAAGINIDQQVYFIGKEEFEDVFSNETWVKVANACWEKNSGDDWTCADFEGIRQSEKKFSKGLLEMLCRECKRDFTKPEIGLELAKSIEDKNEIPSVLQRCFEKAYDYANS